MFILYLINFGLMVGMPLALGYGLARMFHVKPGLFALGAVTFIASQVVHIPLNLGLTYLFSVGLLPAPPLGYTLGFNAIVLGLTAGLCEEIARYLVYQHWLKAQRTWPEALMFGTGHGGIEAIILGVLGFINFLALTLLQDMVPAAQQAAAAQQLAELWRAPWYTALFGALERVFAMTFHVAMAVVIWRAVLHRNLGWVVFAIAWHAFLDAGVVYLASTAGAEWAEGFLFALTFINLGLIFYLRRGQPPANAPQTDNGGQQTEPGAA